ncbi:DUF1622 domain-containing protein [Patescibacteria group bacterium]
MIETFLEFVVIVLEVIGVTIIIIGVLKVLYVFGRCFIKRIAVRPLMTEIRIDLSNYLILSLEIIIGRDIIETFLQPSINDIIILAVLVALRTLLAFFLNYEMRHMPKPQLPKLLDENVQK